MLSKGAEVVLKILIDLSQQSGGMALCDSDDIFPEDIGTD